jgi:uncharacterized protein YijF (DUF1287 family)
VARNHVQHGDEVSGSATNGLTFLGEVNTNVTVLYAHNNGSREREEGVILPYTIQYSTVQNIQYGAVDGQ